MKLPAIIKEIGRGQHGARDLPEDVAHELYAAMLDGEVPDLELGAILIALRVKGEGPEELSGFHRALATRVARIEAPQGRALPVLLPSYNGARRQGNLTPLVALLLSRCGVPVVVHGPLEDPGRVTSAAILHELGVFPCRDARAIEQTLASGEVAFAVTETLSPGLARLIATRRRIGVRSSSHTLAKLIDPFPGGSLRVVAVSHPDYVVRMAGFLAATHARALLFRGTEGEPFANPKRRARIAHYEDGLETVLCEAETGTIAGVPNLPLQLDALTTAEWIRSVLAGQVATPIPIIQQLACCLFAAGRAPTLSEATALAATTSKLACAA